MIANLLAARYGLWMAYINAGVLISLDLTSRDALHEAWYGRGLKRNMALLILAGSALTLVENREAWRIAWASTASFFVAAMLDAVCYQALHARERLIKINGSNLVSAAADSVLFPWLAFGIGSPWAMLGLFCTKVLGGCLWSIILLPAFGIAAPQRKGAGYGLLEGRENGYTGRASR